MKRALTSLLALVVVIAVALWATGWYLRYDLRRALTEEELSDIIADINSAPSLPQSFKDTYSDVHPRVFENNFTFSIIDHLLGNGSGASACSAAAKQQGWVSSNPSRARRHLDYVAFVLLLEDNVSQEKCFEYVTTTSNFMYCAIGIHQAALTFFDKPLDSLTVDEQLGLILKLRNPSLYNEEKRPAAYAKGIKNLKDKTRK